MEIVLYLFLGFITLFAAIMIIIDPKKSFNITMRVLDFCLGGFTSNQHSSISKPIHKVVPKIKKVYQAPEPTYHQESVAYVGGDMADYEYSSDGKRMCFINIHTGHTVYHEDALFHDLKRQMLSN